MYWATGLPGWMRYGAGPWWGGAEPYWPGPWATPSREDELAFLKDEVESAREYLEEVEQRISELEREEE
jgi:hypothetical protein